MILPPPISTLFPYTTLFRSNTTVLSVLGADLAAESNLTYTWAATGTPPAPVQFSANGTNAAKDRKSTRLNSSHRCISYAVFCLKKKKNNAKYMINNSKIQKQ